MGSRRVEDQFMRPLKVIITVKAKLTRVTIDHCRVQFTHNQHHIVSLMVIMLLKPEVRAKIVKINRKNLLESSSTRQKRGKKPLRQPKPNLSKWQVILHPHPEDSSPAVINSRWNPLQKLRHLHSPNKAVHSLLHHQLKCLRQRQRV